MQFCPGDVSRTVHLNLENYTLVSWYQLGIRILIWYHNVHTSSRAVGSARQEMVMSHCRTVSAGDSPNPAPFSVRGLHYWEQAWDEVVERSHTTMVLAANEQDKYTSQVVKDYFYACTTPQKIRDQSANSWTLSSPNHLWNQYVQRKMEYRGINNSRDVQKQDY